MSKMPLVYSGINYHFSQFFNHKKKKKKKPIWALTAFWFSQRQKQNLKNTKVRGGVTEENISVRTAGENERTPIGNGTHHPTAARSRPRRVFAASLRDPGFINR